MPNDFIALLVQPSRAWYFLCFDVNSEFNKRSTRGSRSGSLYKFLNMFALITFSTVFVDLAELCEAEDALEYTENTSS